MNVHKIINVVFYGVLQAGLKKRSCLRQVDFRGGQVAFHAYFPDR